MELINIFKMQKFYNITFIICMIICVGEAILLPFSNNMKENEDESKEIPIIDPKGHVSLINSIILMIIAFTIIILFVWHFKIYFSYLYIPTLIIAFYFIIIKPFISTEDKKLLCTSYSALCCLFCSILQNIKYESITNFFSNTLLLKSIILIIILFKIYIFMFSILINIKYFLKLVKSILKPKNIHYTLSEKLKISYNKSFNCRELKGKATIPVIICYIFESIFNIIKLIINFINELFIIPILFIIRSILKSINIIILYDDGQFNFILCKFLLVVTFIVGYIVIIIDKSFPSEIINIYEYLSTAIIIPVLLDSAISYKNYIKKVK